MFSYFKRLGQSLKQFWHNIIIIFNYKDIQNFLNSNWKALKKEKNLIGYKLSNLRAVNIEVGLYHYYKRNFKDAIFRFKLIKFFCQNEPIAYYNLGRCYYIEGKENKALKELNSAQSLPFNPSSEISFYLKKIKDATLITLIPFSITREKFNFIASRYIEEFLIPNNYLGFQFILEVTSTFFYNRLPNIEILDLGCGTGICAHYLRMYEIGNNVHGVDLSYNMLKIASQCSVNEVPVYNELFNEDIFTYLQNSQKQYDLIIASETFGYIGELKEILELCIKALTTDGLLIFIVRTSPTTSGFTLDLNNDIFYYSDKYINATLKNINAVTFNAEVVNLYTNLPALLYTVQKNAPSI